MAVNQLKHRRSHGAARTVPIMPSHYAALNQWGELEVRQASTGQPVAGEFITAGAPERMLGEATRWLTTRHAGYRIVGDWAVDGDGWRVDLDLG